MRSLAFLLLTALIFVLMAGETDAAKEPLWSRGVQSGVESIAISGGGEYIAAGTGSELVRFDKDSDSWSYSASGPETVAISANGQYIAAGFYDEDNVRLFDTNGNEPIWIYDIGNSVTSVDITASGEYIAVGTNTKSKEAGIYLFHKDSNEPLWNYDTTGGAGILVAISADGEYIAAGTGNDGVLLFDKDNSTPLWNYDTGGDDVLSVGISADGNYIAAGTDDRIYLLDSSNGELLWSHDTGNRVDAVSISADGNYIAAGTSDDGVWLFDNDGSDVDNKQPLWIYDTGGDIRSVAISADGEYIAASSMDFNVYLFDKDRDTPLWSYYTGGHVVNTVDISADGEYIAAGTDNAVVYLFDKTATDLWQGEEVVVDKEQTDEEAIKEWKAFWFPIQIAILVVLASLLYVRRDTGYENPFNKVVKVFVYGISILLLLGSLLVLIVASVIMALVDAPEEMRNPGWMWLLFAILFALTGSFLGHESNSYSSPSSGLGQSSTSPYIPSSRPIFANRPAAPMFKPDNETTPIECPECGAQMQVPKLGTMQTVTCKSCGISGEIKI